MLLSCIPSSIPGSVTSSVACSYFLWGQLDSSSHQGVALTSLRLSISFLCGPYTLQGSHLEFLHKALWYVLNTLRLASVLDFSSPTRGVSAPRAGTICHTFPLSPTVSYTGLGIEGSQILPSAESKGHLEDIEVDFAVLAFFTHLALFALQCAFTSSSYLLRR